MDRCGVFTGGAIVGWYGRGEKPVLLLAGAWNGLAV